MRRNKFVNTLLIGLIIFAEQGCGHRVNSLAGKWKSLVPVSDKNGIDFNIVFENNNTFDVEANGRGQNQTVSGNYKVWDDTIIINDYSEKPMQLCNYNDTGEYIFTRRGDTVYFKTIKDNCERRKLTLEIGLLKAK